MDVRSLWLPDHSVQALKMISANGPLQLNELQVDDVMSLGGHELIALVDDASVHVTRQGARFLSASETRSGSPQAAR